MARLGGLGHQLYTGEFSVDLMGRRRIWYALSSFVLLISIVSLAVRGLTLSIEFRGGAQFTVPAHGHTVAQAQSALNTVGLGGDKSVVQLAGNGSNQKIEITTPELNSNARAVQVEQALSKGLGVPVDQLNPQQVGASWGSDITKKAIESLVVFIFAVVIYLSIRYDPKMAVAAIVGVLHDLLVTAGIYSLVGFEVSPSTVIALLTILGYSLYDTVVVFDKVKENTAGLGPHSRTTFTQATNLAVNQTLARSINTSIIALLPVAGLLFIGAGLLGAGTLKDLSLALFIGLASGAYSSVFIASPLLCDMREREPAMRQLARRVANREALDSRTAATTADGEPAVHGATAASVTAGVTGAGLGGGIGTGGGVSTGGGVGTGGATVRNEQAAQARRRSGGAKRRR